MNGLRYCAECDSTRDENISTAGENFVYDRWLSRTLTAEEIVDCLNSILDSLQLAYTKELK